MRRSLLTRKDWRRMRLRLGRKAVNKGNEAMTGVEDQMHTSAESVAPGRA